MGRVSYPNRNWNIQKEHGGVPSRIEQFDIGNRDTGAQPVQT